MKKIIGSRQAAELARKKFGPRAYVQRCGKVFRVGVAFQFGRFIPDFIKGAKGYGRSWAEALQNAGVEIPKIEITCQDEVTSKVNEVMATINTLLTDTDAKDTDNGNE